MKRIRIDRKPSARSVVRGLVPRPARRLVRLLATMPARLTHARRRRRARASLPDVSTVRRILVLCHGNICRSPFVAVQLQQKLPGGADTRVESAGFLAGGRESPIEARTAARARGVELDGHRSRQLEASELDATDLIIVMEPPQSERVAALAPHMRERILVLGDLDPAPFQTADVPDPWGRPPVEFARCYVRLDRCTAELVRLLWPHT